MSFSFAPSSQQLTFSSPSMYTSSGAGPLVPYNPPSADISIMDDDLEASLAGLTAQERELVFSEHFVVPTPSGSSGEMVSYGTPQTWNHENDYDRGREFEELDDDDDDGNGYFNRSNSRFSGSLSSRVSRALKGLKWLAGTTYDKVADGLGVVAKHGPLKTIGAAYLVARLGGPLWELVDAMTQFGANEVTSAIKSKMTDTTDVQKSQLLQLTSVVHDLAETIAKNKKNDTPPPSHYSNNDSCASTHQKHRSERLSIEAAPKSTPTPTPTVKGWMYGT